MKKIQESELILNDDGSIYHLHLLPEHISDTILLVGDQDRVPEISKYFEIKEFEVRNREFNTHTGSYKGKRLTVLSTGIGTDNIDIVLNELDALVNIDLKSRKPKKEHKTLKFIRIGTSGALQDFVPVDTPLASKYACGFDGLLNFYARGNEPTLEDAEISFKKQMKWNAKLATPYFVRCSPELFEQIAKDMHCGITVSAPGFYGPQGRILRLPLQDNKINDKITRFEYNGYKITNYEMECSAIYGLSLLLGHEALTVCNIIANRITGEFSHNYKTSMESLITTVLDRI